MVPRAPDHAGVYRVEFDIVSEHVGWFENLGSPTLDCPATVE